MSLRYGCKCGYGVGINQLSTMKHGVCATCARLDQQKVIQAKMQAQWSSRGDAAKTEKEVFGETIREQLAIDSDADSGETK